MRRALAAAVFVVLVSTNATVAQVDPRPPGTTTHGVWIEDQKHRLSLVAGDVADNNVYHQAPAGRANALWRLDPVGNGSFLVTDLKHNRSLVAGDNYDQRVYHQPPNGRPNAQWKFIPNGDGTFTIYDMKHGKALVAGDVADNRVYHQDPNGRLNARWVVRSSRAPSANGRAVIRSGEVLRTGESIVNGSFFAMMQNDGRLCAFQGRPGAPEGPAYWCSSVTGTGGKFAAFVGYDGNLCTTQGDQWGEGPNLWCTNKVTPADRAYLMMNGDGNLITVAGTPEQPGAQLWHHGIVFSQVAITSPANGSVKWPDEKLCPPNCARNLRVDSSIGLSAVPAGGGYTFNAWTGACSGSANPCVLKVNAGGLQNAGATFSAPMSQVALTAPTTGGTIQWADGQTCPPLCARNLTVGSGIHLKAVASSGYGFKGWTGSCSGTANPCALTVGLGGLQSVGILLGLTDVTITAIVPPNGQIRWQDATTCAATCTKTVPPSARVTVTAGANPGYVFSSWQGACTGQPNPCSFTAAPNQAVAFSVAALPPPPTSPDTSAVSGAAYSPSLAIVSANAPTAVVSAVNVSANDLAKALQYGTLTAINPAGQSVALPAAVQTQMLALLTGDRTPAASFKTALAAGGAHSAGELVDAMTGLFSAPRTGQFADAVGFFNALMNDSNPTFRANPPAEFLVIHSVITVLTAAAQSGG